MRRPYCPTVSYTYELWTTKDDGSHKLLPLPDDAHADQKLMLIWASVLADAAPNQVGVHIREGAKRV